MLCLPACAITADQVRPVYSQQASCPMDRIRSLVAHPELLASEVIFPHAGRDLPPERLNAPPEILADPARLALWREEKAALLRRTWDGASVFEVDACGKHGFIFCNSEQDANRPISCISMESLALPVK
jgi:hypothetical protein